ncbi:MAG: glycosyltransferase family protein [Gemmatimonadales bacterium]|nr:glycosyltransferase family protein [Gemmatimonadales bacterium]
MAEYRSNHGHALRLLGRLAEAEAELLEATRLEPGLVDSWINLGLVRLDREDPAGAVAALEVAALRAPRSALAHLNLGTAYQRAGGIEDALREYRAAADLAVDLAPAHRNAGVAAQLLGRLDEAIGAYRRALTLVPDDPDVLTNLGVALVAAGDLPAALAAHDRAVTVAPHLGEAWLNRGTALQAAGRLAEAVEAFRRATALDGGARADTALGSALAEAGDFAGAIGEHEAALAKAPDFADAHWNLALALLGNGRLDRGWDAYEWRWRASNRPAEFRNYPWPVWGGEPAEGRRILVWREQGLGDELLFLTCLADLIATGAAVTVLANPRLVTLLQRAYPAADILPDEPGVQSSEATFDWHLPIGSLPRHLRRSRAAFDGSRADLEPRADRVATWRTRLAALGGSARIGVCWRSGLRGADRERHYADLGAWAALWRTPGVRWVNLQYDECEAELVAIESVTGVRIHRWAGEDLRNDLEGVAGLLGALDGVVTAPTAVSSLAGALGVPTWQLDSGNDWTLLGEERSPWFPSIRVFRKGAEASGWEPAIARIATDLRRWTMDREAGA